MTRESQIPAPLRNADAILTAIGDAGGYGIDAKALADNTGLGQRMVYRYLASLRELGLVSGETETGHHRIGPRLLDIARNATGQFELFSNAAEYTKIAATKLNRPVHMSVYNEGTALTVAFCDGGINTEIKSRVGSRRPAHASASGKLFLAHNPTSFRAYVTRPLNAYTDKTIVKIRDLENECLTVRERDWSVDAFEWHPALFCVAVPIRGADGKVLGTLAVSEPQCENQAENARRLIRSLKPVARDISGLLGATR